MSVHILHAHHALLPSSPSSASPAPHPDSGVVVMGEVLPCLLQYGVVVEEEGGIGVGLEPGETEQGVEVLEGRLSLLEGCYGDGDDVGEGVMRPQALHQG